MNRIVCMERTCWKVMLRCRLIRILACMVSLVLPASVGAQSSQPPTIHAPRVTATVACGINNKGQVVGAFSDSSAHIRGFLDSGGAFTAIDFPGAVATAACGINNAGQIVGTFIDASGHYHGFLDNGGVFTTIDVPGAVGTAARGINDSGQIVGGWDAGIINERGSEEYHGFLDNGGTFTMIDAPDFYYGLNGAGPNEYMTIALGVNNSGQVVGMFRADTSTDESWHGFVYSGGTFATIDDPSGAACTGYSSPNAAPQTFTEVDTFAIGINGAGQIAGIFRVPSGAPNCTRPFVYHSFLSNGGTFATTDVPGARFTWTLGINDQAELVGGFLDSNARIHGFSYNNGAFTTIDYPTVTLVDPVVPALLNGPALVTATTQQNIDALATQGRPVQGVAADGVTELLIQIPAQNAGDQFTITLDNDQGVESASSDDDGALGNPGDTTFTQSTLSVTAVSTTNNGPMAFAVYRAPADFVRATPPTGSITCGGITGQAGQPQDPQLPCRTVSLQISGPGGPSATTITIVRPPVILIHGIWSDPVDTWGNFDALTQGHLTPVAQDPRFSVTMAEYDTPLLGLLVFSTPSYGNGALSKAKTNALGFQFNAPRVMDQMQVALAVFRNGGNEVGIPVAAVQADVVAHSMGGDIARAMVLEPGYLSDETFGQGIIHKMITIDTPYLGTPVAPDILLPVNDCVRTLMAHAGSIAFQTVVTRLGSFNGAVWDLRGYGTPANLSGELTALRNSNIHPIPTALLAGVMNSSNLAGLNGALLHQICGTGITIGGVTEWPPLYDPLALALTPTGWPTVFNQDSDGIVPLTSQVNDLAIPPLPGGYVHSRGTENLGFNGPSVLDPGVFATQVINLLNTPVTDPSFHPLNP